MCQRLVDPLLSELHCAYYALAIWRRDVPAGSGILCRKPSMQRAAALFLLQPKQALPQIRIPPGKIGQAFEDSPEIQPRPAHQDGYGSRGTHLGYGLIRRPEKITQRKVPIGILQIQSAVGNSFTHGLRRLGRSNVQSPKDWHGIGAEDPATEPLSQNQRDFALAGCGRAHDDDGGRAGSRGPGQPKSPFCLWSSLDRLTTSLRWSWQ